MIEELERLAGRAWPAEITAGMAGWELRRTHGPSRRYNSASPHRPAPDRKDRIEAVEEWYREHGARAIFKMTEAADPSDLDAELASRSYDYQSPTLVLTRPLYGEGRSAEVQSAAIDPAVVDAGSLSDGWLATSGWSSQRSALEETLTRVEGRIGFLGVPHAHRWLAVCLVVVVGDQAGLFAMVTRPDRRRLGLGTRVLRGALAWAAGQSASRAFLQVEEANVAARRLYERNGFNHSYSYWYRVAPDTIAR